jgi:CheY-like chemotaxis protein/HPt (histidine-containing phosphotransfer) domain-containing protein
MVMAIADDIAARLAGEFLDDAGDRLARAQVALTGLANRPKDPRPLVLDLAREIHNLKGSGRTFGFPAVSLVADRFEEFLEARIETPPLPVAELQRFADALVDLIESGRNPDADRTAAILRGLPMVSEFDPDSVVGRPGRALVVTRARTLNHMLGRELANCGYQTRSANDPFEAIRIAATEKPDVVLTSAVLDGLPGIDLLRALRAMRPTRPLPVAVVTSFDAGHPELAGLPPDVPVVRLGRTLSDDLAKVLTDAGEKTPR